MDLVTTLRSARERRGLSVESLARATKIKVTLLRAIEEGNFDQVPPGIFRRGFLRSYAREVGLDPETIVRQYAEEFEPAPTKAAPDLPVRPAARRVSSAGRTSNDALARTRADVQWVTVGVLVAALIAYVFLFPRVPLRAARPPQAMLAPAPTAIPHPVAAAPRPVAASPKPVATAGAALQMELSAKAPCWIAATAGGERLAYTLLRSGDHRTITAHDELVLRVGDPGALNYTINGAPGRPLGRTGQPVTVRIAPGNYRQFLAAARPTGG